MAHFSVPVLAVSVLALAQPAWANTEDLARQVWNLQQIVQSLDIRLGKLEQNNRVLALLQEVETLKTEVSRLRGKDEVQDHRMDTLGKRQNDLYVDLDARIADIAKVAKAAPAAVAAQSSSPSPIAAPEPVAPPPAAGTQESPAPFAAPVVAEPSKPVSPPPPQLDPLVESRTYESAFNQFREANYAGAIAGFKGFLRAYPDSALAPNAQYWIGYSYYALKDYKTALAHQQKLVAMYPTSAKIPDSMFNIATNQIALDDLAGARKTLEELVAKHPDTKAASLANRRLAALR